MSSSAPSRARENIVVHCWAAGRTWQDAQSWHKTALPPPYTRCSTTGSADCGLWPPACKVLTFVSVVKKSSFDEDERAMCPRSRRGLPVRQRGQGRRAPHCVSCSGLQICRLGRIFSAPHPRCRLQPVHSAPALLAHENRQPSCCPPKIITTSFLWFLSIIVMTRQIRYPSILPSVEIRHEPLPGVNLPLILQRGTLPACTSPPQHRDLRCARLSRLLMSFFAISRQLFAVIQRRLRAADERNVALRISPWKPRSCTPCSPPR